LIIPVLNINRKWLERLIFRPFLLLVCLLIIGQSQAAAQSYNVVDIKVEGNRIASTSLILSVCGIHKGDELTASLTQDAVRRLYGLGFFRDVQILADEVTGGLSLVIKVDELPKLEKVVFKGNKEIDSDDLTKKLGLTGGNYLSNELIYEKKNEIVDLYGEKGYFMVKVDYSLDYLNDSTAAILTYNIKEGSKVKVKKVILTGNVHVKADKIIGQMRNRKRGFLKSSNFDKEKYPEDKDKIIEYLHKEGYIDAYLKSDSIVTDTTTNRMTIYLDIYEGPRYIFGKTTWSGNEVFDPHILNKTLKYSEGQIFNSEKFEESMNEIYFLYQEKGYLHVRVIDDRNTRDSAIDINFDIVEGLPSEVNLVKIIGNTKTREKVIRREMVMRPGQVFHRSFLMRSIRNIMQLNYFSNVTPDINPLPSGDVDVVVEVEEKPTAQISAGAGYSGTDKFVGTLGLGIPNFRGMGQNLSLNVDIGSKRNSYSISFTEPWMFSTPTSLGADLYYTNREWYSDYTEGRRGGSFRLGRRLRWPDDYFSIVGRYQIEDDRFYDFSDDYRDAHSYTTRETYMYVDTAGDTLSHSNIFYGGPLPSSLTRFNDKWFSSSSVQFTITRDSRDLPEFSTRGSDISYSIEVVGGWLGGYWKYHKHILTAAKFIPVWGKIALAGKLTLGAITAQNDLNILEFDRFSPGGTDYFGIVRGYESGSLTPDTIITTRTRVLHYADDDLSQPPTDTTYETAAYTTTVRGKYLMVGNIELQIPISENQLYGILFYDMGNSWLNSSDVKINDLYRGVGLGFRLVVPGIGTIGFDFGYPLDERSDQKKGWRPHFQIGTTFR
jgi:outer membrane protein insertion porin family